MRWPIVLAALLALSPALASAQDNPVDDRIRGSAMAAEGLQGPFDGAWTLVGGDNRAILALQLVDRPGGQGFVEGVWRDLRRPSTPGDIGLIDIIDRGAGALTMTINATAHSQAITVSLHSGPTGWSGDLREGSAPATPVRLRRAG